MKTKSKLPFPRRFLKSTITVALISISCAIAPLPVWAQPTQLSKSPLNLLTIAAAQKELDFSGTGRPGRQTAGESRSECPPVKAKLTALVPTSNTGKTLSDRPTFLFYVPYSPEQAPVGEFVLQDENRNDIYRTPFSLSQAPGLVSFSIPKTETPLEVGEWYRWYFKLYCKSQKTSSPVFVQGWVQRVALAPTLESQLNNAAPREDITYATHQIWYDAIAHLANLRLTNPTSAELEKYWKKLLQAKGVDLALLSSERIVGSVELDIRN